MGSNLAAVDHVCAMAIMSVDGIIELFVHCDISYFAPAMLHVCTQHITTSLPTSVFSLVSFSFTFILPSSAGCQKN